MGHLVLMTILFQDPSPSHRVDLNQVSESCPLLNQKVISKSGAQPQGLKGDQSGEDGQEHGIQPL
jgi:hypothetical protein